MKYGETLVNFNKNGMAIPHFKPLPGNDNGFGGIQKCVYVYLFSMFYPLYNRNVRIHLRILQFLRKSM